MLCNRLESENIKTYWPAGGGRGQNQENTAQGNSVQNPKRHKQTLTRASNLEKSREILTSLAPSCSRKLNFHSLSLLNFQDFEEKILFLFSIYENLKHKSRSLLDLDLEFSSGSVCLWN